MLALDDLLEALDRVLEPDVLARRPGELLGDEVRLREEALDAPRPVDGQLVLVRELVDPEDRDDVLQVLVALQDLLDARRRLVVLVGDDSRLERARERRERVHRRVDPHLHDRPLEHHRRVEVRERVRRRGVGVVVRRDEDRLDRRDRAGLRRGDALLQLAHLGRERRLVADRARHAAEQRRDLGAGLDEAEDVVDEEQHVLALIAEVLGHRQPREADAQSRSGRLVHLPVAERDLVDHLALLHLEPEVVALARALADARRRRRRRRAPWRRCGSAPGSAPSCRRPAPPNRPTLPPRMNGAIRSITLIPVSKISISGERSTNAGGSRWIGQRSPVAALSLVDRVADDVPDAAERLVADRDGDRRRPCRRRRLRAGGRRSSPSPPRGRGRRRGAAAPPRSGRSRAVRRSRER